MTASPTDFDLAACVAILERTPSVVRAILSGLSDEWINASEGADTFTPYDVVGHLIHGERADWIPRAKIILAQGPDRKFTPYDRFAQFEESKGKSLRRLLDELEQLRANNLGILAKWNLSAAALDLTGEHPEFGAVTLRQLLATWAAHDLSHIAQIARVMAKQYRDTVGPWRVYLPILDR